MFGKQRDIIIGFDKIVKIRNKALYRGFDNFAEYKRYKEFIDHVPIGYSKIYIDSKSRKINEVYYPSDKSIRTLLNDPYNNIYYSIQNIVISQDKSPLIQEE